MSYDFSTRYNPQVLLQEFSSLFQTLSRLHNLHSVRKRLFLEVSRFQFDTLPGKAGSKSTSTIIARDCARVLRGMFNERAETLSGFSVAQAVWDLACRKPRPDLEPGFFAEMIHILRGCRGEALFPAIHEYSIPDNLSGREAAVHRSRNLDQIWSSVQSKMDCYPDGLCRESRDRRSKRREHILSRLGGSEEDWKDWKWHIRHVAGDPEILSELVMLREDERESVKRAVREKLPFGITPYYLSLMDENPDEGRDRAIRAQVLPPADYVSEMSGHRDDRNQSFDFMREGDTSPIDLVTRRYPGIAILKPFNTCPQICVYCQRNWEIQEPMAPGSLASAESIEAACAWIARHPSIHEVLVTGGDPLALNDEALRRILRRLAEIPSLDMIRIGSRVPVTIPMRVTEDLADLIGSLRIPGVREVCLVTHVEHSYEVTPEFVLAVDRLKRRGISVYNQLVFTFFVSRRFEAARLRTLLRKCGVDPYYTFAPKGKEETRSYRVPLARLLQEQKEESRLLPGTRRTDEIVYNVPGLGKNYLRALQHRDILSILPNGARVYEFHPWEKNIVLRDTFIGTDVPILDYLNRLSGSGEDPRDYEGIWYYF